MMSSLIAVVGFPAYYLLSKHCCVGLCTSCASHEVAWQLGVVPYHDGTQSVKREEYSIDFNRRTWR